ncbi:MAG: bifunctional UDP-N-acetylglucosamine diphosphorylase/glucosamine-1-phosphate N-acetyltransferase GlmU [Streptosporangiales bacterium]|nr:bifunctional UDP-N-acetylglucosamine diphosphorylase/glucosamine-1-phosphate N-acetyltransferase GlmU [Streptosporangiales bacterium]
MSVSRPAAVIVLAAGEGTRMKSRQPKILHDLCGRSMLGHVLAATGHLEPERTIVVVGYGRDQVRAHLAEIAPGAETVVQADQRGTGNAVRQVAETAGIPRGTVLVTNGDHPLLRGEIFAELLAAHEAGGNAVTVLSVQVPDPHGYGRIVRDESGDFAEIVEEKETTPAQQGIHEINTGMYAFDGGLLGDVVKRIGSDNTKGEEYLTDAIAILRGDGHKVGAAIAEDWVELQGVNDRVQLAEARRMLNERLLNGWMRAGVTFVDPRTAWIDVTVTFERDAVIEPNTQLRGATHIGEGAHVGPGVVLTDTTVGAEATLVNAVADGAEIGPGASVGPYAYLRPGTRLGARAKAGTYVEMKNAVVGEGTKIPHLTYVGDAEIGSGSNIGASTVFVNYDGVAKHKTKVGDHVRVGSDTMLVGPLTIGDGAYTAAGSVITKDVPPGALGVARGQQRNIEGWVERRRSGTASADAAKRARGEDAERSEHRKD